RALVSAGKPLLLLNPPHVPHLPGLLACGLAPQDLVWIEAATPQQQLWAAEQAIKSNAAGAIIAWLPQARPEQIRRLQTHALAAESPIFVLRPLTLAQQQSSAAPLRLAVETGDGWALSLRILKRRGPVFEGRLDLLAMPTDLARALSPRMLQARPAGPHPFPPTVEPRRHALARAASHQPAAHG
ncbi:recombinase RecA, partial [Pelomonas sp. KK5]|uniref:recombinase RecA n=1 Tax=Pelomonas sp. KK5 TaxID=1855730 RepID=UPI001E3D82FC